MRRLGTAAADMREMNFDDVFISRLKLLIIMSSAYLKNYPLGDYRKKAIIRNANGVARELVHWQGPAGDLHYRHELKEDSTFDHIFFQRVKLLAVMAKAVAEDCPMGHHRLKAMENNLNFICEAIRFNRQLWEKTFFKVA